MEIIDTHAHLYLPQFKNDLPQVIENAQNRGIKHIYMPNIDVESVEPMLEIANQYPNCYATIGLHPCSVKKDFEKQLYQLEQWLSKETKHFVAIGEIGTDLYWDKTLIEQQKEALKIQIDWAKKYNLPIIIHCRESIDITIDIVKEKKEDTLKGIFHCFSGSLEQAQNIIELDFLLGIGGVVTYKNAGLDKVVTQLNLDNIVLETDAPYLTPNPHRGKRNEPAMLEFIIQKIADTLHTDSETIAQKTTENAQKLFSLSCKS
ncbi:MAG: TatD family deoxyribonuclease [Cytophagales bacterium]|nr:MAG: TatD family deoxyribonuclease [Cytophagales bacterium]